MEHFGLFDNKVIHQFDFSGEYIGYVLDNSEYENTLMIKVFIPELFGYNYTPSIKNIDNTVELSKSHILNNEDLNITTRINKQEYLYARILIERHFLNESKTDFIKSTKPEVGQKVIVSFFNNNPNNCVYTNTVFLSDGEAIKFSDGESIDIIRTSNARDDSNTTDKITWEFIT